MADTPASYSAVGILPEPHLPIELTSSRWSRFEPLKHPIPNASGESGWERCQKRVHEYDEDMCKALKDEIDKLLIFAGLFSAAVTAFVIESYQWLETSNDPTADLLAQFIAIQLNTTSPLTAATPSTTPSESAIRINICWFVSLVLSLSSVLIGILCLQWLREYERPVATSSQVKLQYRQVRFEGLRAWKVPEIIRFLPFLLEFAVVLFFVGVFDLLWERNHTVAIIVLLPISLTISFIIATTLIPTIQTFLIWLDGNWAKHFPQCPYKSPLSWSIYHLISPFLYFGGERPHSWQRFDYPWADGISTSAGASVRSFQWMQNEFTEDSSMISPLNNCIDGMDDRMIVELRSTVRMEIFGHLHEHEYPDPFVEGNLSDPRIIRELASVLQLSNSPILGHHTTLVEHSIRLGYADTQFILLIPEHWRSITPLELHEEFAEQILMCTLSAMITSPDVPRAMSRVIPKIRSVIRMEPVATSRTFSLLQANLYRIILLQASLHLSTPSFNWDILLDFDTLSYMSKHRNILPYYLDFAWFALKCAEIAPRDYDLIWQPVFRLSLQEYMDKDMYDRELCWSKEFLQREVQGGSQIDVPSFVSLESRDDLTRESWTGPDS